MVALFATLLASVMLGRHLVIKVADHWSSVGAWEQVRVGLFALAIVALLYGNVVYQLSRLGAHLRRARHATPAYDTLLADQQGLDLPPVAILVPSYKEDLRTIRQTVLSAALQDYPNRRVILLIDDPPNPSSPGDAARLDEARALPVELSALLGQLRIELEAMAGASRARRGTAYEPRRELYALLQAFSHVDAWLATQASATSPEDHTDRLFARLVFERHRELLRPTAQRVVGAFSRGAFEPEEIDRLYGWLIAQFTVEIAAFERKRYVNLSHESNKAANLNSYLGLIGQTVREMRADEGTHLVPCDPTAPDSASIPDAPYVITLDADSLLAPDYARRLVAIMEAPGNERIAVAQTPYTAIPRASRIVERIAGATTDIQYLVHQGFTAFGATFWVGANALLRKAALDDIREEDVDRGYRVPRFIQDRTVIEDTESTIDLICRGWRLHNEPERLAYSATPPDFGALLIQRRRWANGGLLILPKLVRYAISQPLDWRLPLEVLIRAHYLGSLALSTLALAILLFFPVDEELMTPWLVLAGIPYVLLYWRDLLHAGYRRGDIFRVHAFNWLLLPINAAGVLKSLQQAVTRQKIPFGRTPKVEGRTAMPAWAAVVEWGLFLYAVNATVWDAGAGRWYHAALASTTALTFGYALVRFVGVRESVEDLLIGLRGITRRLTLPLAARPTSSRGYGD